MPEPPTGSPESVWENEFRAATAASIASETKVRQYNLDRSKRFATVTRYHRGGGAGRHGSTPLAFRSGCGLS
jgi:hypothetical protein